MRSKTTSHFVSCVDDLVGMIRSWCEQETWMEEGLCAQTDPVLFFPGKGEAEIAVQAQKICAMCSVKQQCLDYAVRTGQYYGVWGGLTERHVRRLIWDRKEEVLA